MFVNRLYTKHIEAKGGIANCPSTYDTVSTAFQAICQDKSISCVSFAVLLRLVGRCSLYMDYLYARTYIRTHAHSCKSVHTTDSFIDVGLLICYLARYLLCGLCHWSRPPAQPACQRFKQVKYSI